MFIKDIINAEKTKYDMSSAEFIESYYGEGLVREYFARDMPSFDEYTSARLADKRNCGKRNVGDFGARSSGTGKNKTEFTDGTLI